jgi:hypothetical protein
LIELEPPSVRPRGQKNRRVLHAACGTVTVAQPAEPAPTIP